jgi:hypothetical protein
MIVLVDLGCELISVKTFTYAAGNTDVSYSRGFKRSSKKGRYLE